MMVSSGWCSIVDTCWDGFLGSNQNQQQQVVPTRTNQNQNQPEPATGGDQPSEATPAAP